MDLTMLVDRSKAHTVGMCFGEENLGGYNCWTQSTDGASKEYNNKRTVWIRQLIDLTPPREGPDLTKLLESGCTGYDPKMGCFALEEP